MNHRDGFTLIETLAATALAAIMMTAVMTVVTAIARSDKAVGVDPHDADWRRRVVWVIKRDLQHADEIQSLDDRVILTGHVSLDPQTLKPTHLRAEVTYAIRQHAGKSWLIRTQTDPQSRSLHNAWAQVVCAEVSGLAVSTQAGATEDTSAESSPTSDDQADTNPTEHRPEVPVETATLTLTWAQETDAATTTTMLIR